MSSSDENGRRRSTEEDDTGKRETDGEGSSHFESSVDAAEVPAFEDLLQLMGTKGRWNYLILFLCSYCSLINALQIMSYQFLGETPDYWCHVGPLVEANWTQEQIISFAIPNKTGIHEKCEMYNYDYEEVAGLGYEGAVEAGLTPLPDNTSVVPCYSRDFNLTQYESTVTIEWDLVCERRALYSTTHGASAAGAMLGFLISGYLFDRYGRRPIVLCCSLLGTTTSFLICYSNSIELYIFLKLVNIIMLASVYLGNFVIVMEISTTKGRSKFGPMFTLPWAIGYMIMPGIAFFVRRWRWLQGAFTLPAVVCSLYYWFLPESPRWLILQGRYKEAFQVLHWGARVNRRTLPPDQDLLVLMEKIRPMKVSRDEEVQETLFKRAVGAMKQVVVLFSTQELRRRTLISFTCWFISPLVYYGVALNSINLSTNLYIYMFLGGLLEVPSYLLLWPAVVLLGRRKTLSSLYFVCAFSILLLTIFIVFLPEAPKAVVMLFSLIGKMAITAAFHLLWMFTAELFPTKYRSMAVGQCSVLGRIGSMFSPYVNDILGELVVWGPSAVFGCASLVAACLSLLLPETGRSNLADTQQPLRQCRQ